MHCNINIQRRNGLHHLIPTIKTPKGCIRECKCGERNHKICDDQSNCPLLRQESGDLNDGEDNLDNGECFDDDEDFNDTGENGDFLEDNQVAEIIQQNEITKYPVPILTNPTIEKKMVSIFLNENFKTGGEIDNKTLRSAFQKWCISNSQKPVSDKLFKKIMIDLGFTIKEPNNPIWQNIHFQYGESFEFLPNKP